MQRLVTTTYLEMTDPAQARLAPTGGRINANKFDLVQSEIPCPEVNRFFYLAVGSPWWWVSRRQWNYSDWYNYLNRPETETWIAYVAGTPAGYFELERQDGDNRRGDTVEITYFGLLSTFIGQGLGSALLTAAISRAWTMGAARVWVHTCTLDHPNALQNYQDRGFTIFRVEEAIEDLPDQPLNFWP